MKEIQYKKFSWQTHAKNAELNRPNVAQFELTFKCGLHCKHCYTDCYNNPGRIKDELSTREIKVILDKLYKAGIVWVCFTGGDPLARKDFLDIYSYAKNKGFIVTIFTNGYSMTEDIATNLQKKPPFVIEMTLNAATEKLYEKISRVKGSFAKTMMGIELILRAKIPLKIKTQVTKDNFREIPKIKKFIEGIGLSFKPSFDLFARLNGDLTPCDLRISPEQALGLNGNKRLAKDNCQLSAKTDNSEEDAALFRCAAGGGDGVNIDPYGNTFCCNLIRQPYINLLKADVRYSQEKLLPLVRNRKFNTVSKCSKCSLKKVCAICPGRAFLETGDMESPIDYYCKLTKHDQ